MLGEAVRFTLFSQRSRYFLPIVNLETMTCSGSSQLRAFG